MSEPLKPRVTPELLREFPAGAKFTRDASGELWVNWDFGGEPYGERVGSWINRHTIAGTTYDVIETVSGLIAAVILSPPGGGVSEGHEAGRRFRLVRHRDPSGVSGVGVVAYGVEWPDKTVSLRWRGVDAAFANWGSIEAVERIHGHSGATEVEWID